MNVLLFLASLFKFIINSKWSGWLWADAPFFFEERSWDWFIKERQLIPFFSLIQLKRFFCLVGGRRAHNQLSRLFNSKNWWRASERSEGPTQKNQRKKIRTMKPIKPINFNQLFDWIWVGDWAELKDKNEMERKLGRSHITTQIKQKLRKSSWKNWRLIVLTFVLLFSFLVLGYGPEAPLRDWTPLHEFHSFRFITLALSFHCPSEESNTHN